MMNRLLICFFAITLQFNAIAGGSSSLSLNPSINYALEEQSATQAMPMGFNIKISPLLYWHTFLASVEYPIKSIPVNIGINTYASWGFENTQDITVEETWEKAGFGVDVYAKWFLLNAKDRPEGLYVQGNVSYNTIVYQEGVVRPWALNNNASKNQRVDSRPKEFDPNPFNFGVGVGYQLIIIAPHFVADIMLASQFSQNHDGELLPTIYLLPSFGYTF